MLLEIDKDWFNKNAQKLTDSFYSKYSGEENKGDSWKIELDDHNVRLELYDEKNTVSICSDYDKPNDDGLYVSMQSDIDTDQIVELVRRNIDDLNGDTFAKIVEVIVKKFNKFKSTLESLKGI